jgi:hypothetical protein
MHTTLQASVKLSLSSTASQHLSFYNKLILTFTSSLDGTRIAIGNHYQNFSRHQKLPLVFSQEGIWV